MFCIKAIKYSLKVCYFLFKSSNKNKIINLKERNLILYESKVFKKQFFNRKIFSANDSLFCSHCFQVNELGVRDSEFKQRQTWPGEKTCFFSTNVMENFRFIYLSFLKRTLKDVKIMNALKFIINFLNSSKVIFISINFIWLQIILIYLSFANSFEVFLRFYS